MPKLQPIEAVDATRIDVLSDDVDGSLRLGGTPRTGSVELDAPGGVPMGVWEMTAGAMRDVEVDEVFVVVSGEATVDLVEDGEVVATVDLRPGVVCRLRAGMTTRWSVPDRLRKVYLLG